MTEARAAEIRAFVGLGSNLGEPAQQLARALAALEALPRTRLAARSRFYVTSPVGPAEQPEFINAVAVLHTGLQAPALLAGLQDIERRQGRVRQGGRWGPRTLDLDLLMYGQDSVDTPMLTVPHPRMHERAFVLVPLAEVAPDLVIPGHGSVAALASRVSRRGVRLYAA